MLGLRTAIYKVGELEKAKEWNSQAFNVLPYFDEPFYIGFNISGYELGLQQSDLAENKKTESVLTYWGVQNIEMEFQRLISLGASIHEKPTNVGGEIVVASVYDPWENIIGLIYNSEFKAT